MDSLQAQFGCKRKRRSRHDVFCEVRVFIPTTGLDDTNLVALSTNRSTETETTKT